MAGYAPIKIPELKTGLVEDRLDFEVPDDAFTTLENAVVFRGSVLRKRGANTLARLRRVLTAQALGNTSGDPTSLNIVTTLSLETDAEIEVGSLSINVGAGTATFTDNGDGTFAVTGTGDAGTSSINYATGDIVLGFTAGPGVLAIVAAFNYFPNLPVMGLRRRELAAINAEELLAFDTKYCYNLGAGEFREFITGTTWTGTNSDFFWSTNWWVDGSNNGLTWVTNFSGVAGDPIRYTNGTTWTTLAPNLDAGATTQLHQCRCLIPFRSRLLALNTFEGASLALSTQYAQRIRYSAIGSPITATAWESDSRGKGGFIDIPTAQAITSVGFIRDNLVVFCERSTWLLRYTGIKLAPFQVEKVNTELGTDSPFSIVNFDTEVLAAADKGMVACDSFKTSRIDEDKIPDTVIRSFNNDNSGRLRVHGARDYINRMAYWTYPDQQLDPTFPNRRLVYNYEDGNWAIYRDNYTALGIYQDPNDETWASSPDTWAESVRTWGSLQSNQPEIVGGTQKGFVLILDQEAKNDPSLSIQDITGNTTTATTLTVTNHNLEAGQVIEISGIPTGTPFASALNGKVFGVDDVTSADAFNIYAYDSDTGQFDDPVPEAPATYIGGGVISILDNFNIVTKRFSHISKGQKIQMGYIDLLVDSTASGAFTLYTYGDYNTTEVNDGTDAFFNTVVDTTFSALQVQPGARVWQRVICPANANFLQLRYSLSNGQMAAGEQSQDVVINSEVIWERLGGRMTL